MSKQSSTAEKRPPAPEPEPVKIQSLRDEHKRLTRERLITAAVELFTQHGYRATSVGEIAKTAGTTPTTFYRYFTGKADIARLLQDRINIEVKSHLEALDGIDRPTRKAVRGWIDQYGQLWRRVHVLCNAFWEATESEPELAAELVPVTYRLTESMRLIGNMPEGRARDTFQARLVLMYLLMDRLFYLVNIQGRNAVAMKLLEEFSEILWESLFSENVNTQKR
jgi:AcrR family transcriptional regulator